MIQLFLMFLISISASIRAYGAQELFSSRLKSKIDTLSRASYTFFDINRWIAVRVDSLSGIFAASVSAYLVYGGQANAGAAGFTISVVLSFSRQMIWWIRIYNLLEIQGTYSPPFLKKDFSADLWTCNE